MDIRAEIQTRVDEIEQIIKRYLPEEEGWQKTIMEAMNYSILAGGKRLRPMLMSETYRLFGGKSKVIEPFMAAMEMIHTYSLVHDDLPAMDNDEYRRGKKTTHAVYGEAMGILAGDALLNYAFETAAKAFDMEPDNRNIGKAMQILATKAGIYGMVGGQVVDVQSEDSGDITKEKLDLLRDVDFIFRDEISKAELDEKIWQYFAVLTDMRSVGVMGDERTYDYTVALRGVTSVDAMTADWARIPYDVLGVISNRIINEVPHINRIVYDITSKPPATIEWE